MATVKVRSPTAPAQKREARSRIRGLGFDPVLAAVWLYYRDNLTQSEIARLLSVSRPTVVSYLDEGQRRGLFSVRVDAGGARAVEAARELIARYGLTDAFVIPDDGGASNPSDRVGRAGAQVLAGDLIDGDRVGVTFGRTVLALSTAMPNLSLPNVEVVQMTGALAPKNQFSPEVSTSQIARHVGGHANNLLAPIFVSSAKVRAVFMDEPALKQHFELIRSCNRALFGVGELTSKGTIFETGLFNAKDIAPYLKGGAVGSILGHFIDREGRPVRGAFDDRLIGVDLEGLRKIPVRYGFAGGPDKADALRAALRGGYVTHLVTDQLTANRLVKTPP